MSYPGWDGVGVKVDTDLGDDNYEFDLIEFKSKLTEIYISNPDTFADFSFLKTDSLWPRTIIAVTPGRCLVQGSGCCWEHLSSTLQFLAGVLASLPAKQLPAEVRGRQPKLTQ